MKIGIPREIHAGEKRVALTPDVAEKMIKLGFSILVERDAGVLSDILNEDYEKAGCQIISDSLSLWKQAELILKVRAPEMNAQLGKNEVELLEKGQTLICFVWPGQNPELLKKLAASKAHVLAMDCIPRISRAQKMDALSSMANIAGYRAVIEAAHHFGRFFTGQITAAGKVPPAKALVIGAGVAGLAAMGTLSGLGAVVRAFDTRPEVKDQVKSMGAEFLELNFIEEGTGQGGYAKQMSEAFIKAEMELFAQQAKEVDILITTALIPGKKAPTLITQEMVKSMKAGSVIVDLAAEQGGNCELTEPGKVVIKNGVTLIGYTDLPSRLAKQSSQLYASNLWRLLEELTPKKDGVIHINLENEVLRGATIVNAGEILWPPPPPPSMVSVQKAVNDSKLSTPASTSTQASSKAPVKESSLLSLLIPLFVSAVTLLVVGQWAPPEFLARFTVFVLSCFVGYMVVWNVTASLHTPLMSVTNAISGIIAIGAFLQISSSHVVVQVLAGLAILVATINIVGGFTVTHRMLKMFRK